MMLCIQMPSLVRRQIPPPSLHQKYTQFRHWHMIVVVPAITNHKIRPSSLSLLYISNTLVLHSINLLMILKRPPFFHLPSLLLVIPRIPQPHLLRLLIHVYRIFISFRPHPPFLAHVTQLLAPMLHQGVSVGTTCLPARHALSAQPL